jgi:sugar O-acyltransferase (sialic acid O-acetyltransferase NeuD family)
MAGFVPELPTCSLLTKEQSNLSTRRSTVSTDAPVAQRNLVIVGAGQCGREFFVWASQAIAAGAPFMVKGFLDDRADALGGRQYQLGVLGSVTGYEIEEKDVFVCAIGNPATKSKVCSQILGRGGEFTNIIHPLANVGVNVELGVDVVMGPFSSVTCDSRIGSHVSIGALSNVAHDCTLGDYCQLSSHCGVNGSATLGEGVFLGSHACILPGIKVRDVGSCIKVFGNPASVIGATRE